MRSEKQHFRRRLAVVLSTSCWAAALPAFAAKPVDPPPVPGEVGPAADAATGTGKGTRSRNVTINLINRLVEKKILSAEEAAEMIKMAEEDAAAAAGAQVAPAPPMEPALPTAPVAPVEAAVVEPAVVPSLEPTFAATEESVRIPYIPEIVRAQMRDEIKQDLMEQARKEGWAGGQKIPEWVPRFRVNADIRVRYENLHYPEGNDNTGAFPNFNAINTGAPFDVAGNVFSPQYNVDQDRNRTRLRVRIGAEADMGEGFTAGVRIATGADNSPVSVNQSLGLASGQQGGNFSKYALWLDRAFIKYELGDDPSRRFTGTIGRFDNLFFHTDATWDPDLGFDGLAVQGKYGLGHGVTPFITAGAFPIFNTALNFASNQPSKFESQDKWLYAVQFGTDWKVSPDFSAKVAAAYYHFHNVAGKLSDPYTPLTAFDAGSTDETRPSFAQKGNTYMALRNIVPNANNNFGTINQFQYFGLATGFRQVVGTARVDYNGFEPVQLSLVGEYSKNLAFDRDAINARAVNNRGPNQAGGAPGIFDGSDTAWMVDFRVGKPALEKRWDWNAALGYRYIGSDAVIDGFADSAFADGGTNFKGYVVGASVALAERVWMTLRWSSVNSIGGPPFKSDGLQIDFTGKF
ncbi:MAG: putative porin [Chthoniobacteraceae bacterium]